MSTLVEGATRRLALAAFLFGASITSTARAHGTFPSAERVAFDPDDPAFVVVQTSFGMVVTDDAGVTWSWICADVLHALPTEDPRIAVARGGAILAGSFTGLRRGEGRGCSWTSSVELADQVVIDLDRDPAQDDAFVAVTSTGGVPNGVLRSVDGGVHWAPTGVPLGEVLFESIRVAPSEPTRVLLVGAIPPRPPVERQAFVYVSSDAAASFERVAFSELAPRENIHLLAIDPENPDRAYLRATTGNASGASSSTPPDSPERLFRTDDGGRTWQLVLEAPEIGALAFHRGQVFAGGRFGTGLLRSTDGHRFEPIASYAVSCLAARGVELWVCANQYVDGFAVGVSRDGGAAFASALDFDQVRHAHACGATDETTLVCGPLEPTLETTLRPGGGARPGCAVGRGTPSNLMALLAAAAACAAGARRASRPRR